MPRPRPPHLHRERTFRGRIVWYVRIAKGPRIRIRAEFGTPEFDVEYQAAIAGERRPKGGPCVNSLAWLLKSLPRDNGMDDALPGNTAAT